MNRGMWFLDIVVTVLQGLLSSARERVVLSNQFNTYTHSLRRKHSMPYTIQYNTINFI